MRVRVAAVVAGGGGGGGSDSNHPVQHDQDEGMCRYCCQTWDFSSDRRISTN